MYIETIEECDICLMDTDRFEYFLFRHPRFMMNMIKVLSDRISGMSSLAQHLALGNLQDKILYVLLKLSDQFALQSHDEIKTKSQLKIRYYNEKGLAKE